MNEQTKLNGKSMFSSGFSCMSVFFSLRGLTKRPHKAHSQGIGRELGTHKSGLTKRPHKESDANLKHLGTGREYQARTRNEVRVPAPNYKYVAWSRNANREHAT